MENRLIKNCKKEWRYLALKAFKNTVFIIEGYLFKNRKFEKKGSFKKKIIQ